MRFRLLRLGSSWHATLDVLDLRFTSWGHSGAFARTSVFMAALAMIGDRSSIFRRGEITC